MKKINEQELDESIMETLGKMPYSEKIERLKTQIINNSGFEDYKEDNEPSNRIEIKSYELSEKDKKIIEHVEKQFVELSLFIPVMGVVQKSEFIKQTVDEIVLISDAIARSLLAKRLSIECSVSEQLVINQLNVSRYDIKR